MNIDYLVPTPGQSIAVSLSSLNQRQRQATALLWLDSSTGQAPLQLVTSPDKRTAHLSPPPGSITSVLIGELGINLGDAQAQQSVGFPGVLIPLTTCSFAAKLLTLAIAIFLLSPAHPGNLKPSQGAVIGLWAAQLGILPIDIKPYLRTQGAVIYEFMVSKQQ